MKYWSNQRMLKAHAVRASLVVQMLKSLPVIRRPNSIPGFLKIPWRREWLPTPVLLHGEFHGQRSLAGYTVHGSHRVGHEWATNTFHFTFMCSKAGRSRLHTCFYQIAWQSHYILYRIKIWQPSLTPLIYLSKLMEAKPAFMCLLGANVKTLLVRWLLPKCFILYTWNFLRE